MGTIGLLSVLLGFTAGVPVDAPRPTPPQPGPENGGVRLRLTVETQVDGGIDVHKVWLDLINAGDTPVVLVARWPYEQDRENYAGYFAAEVCFVTFPEVVPDSAQTAGGVRTSPQPECTLDPGKSLTVKWTARGRRLKAEHYYNTTPYFPSPGLYGVRARFLAHTKDGREILLVSNEQQVSVDGSVAMPKYATGRIVWAKPENKTVAIDLGARQKIEIGDVFRVQYGLAASWRIDVIKVNDSICEGTVETIARPGGLARVPEFPERLMTATLVAPERLRRQPSAPEQARAETRP